MCDEGQISLKTAAYTSFVTSANPGHVGSDQRRHWLKALARRHWGSEPAPAILVLALGIALVAA